MSIETDRNEPAGALLEDERPDSRSLVEETARRMAELAQHLAFEAEPADFARALDRLAADDEDDARD